jgi:hypothetical protein
VTVLQDLLKILSKDANLTNALATVASVIVALAALVVSAVSLFVGRATLTHQRKHNVLSVRPIPEITVADHEDSLRVKLRNHGSGPLIVTELCVSGGGRVEKALIDWMPDLPDDLFWENFAAPINDRRSLLAGSEIILLELNGDPQNPTFATARDNVRALLSRLTVTVSYTDIYDSCFKAYIRELSWFGR